MLRRVPYDDTIALLPVRFLYFATSISYDRDSFLVVLDILISHPLQYQILVLLAIYQTKSFSNKVHEKHYV